MISMELQPSVHMQHLNHHGIVNSHGLTSLGSPSGQHHSNLLHHQQQQSYQQPHITMHDDKSQKSEFIFRTKQKNNKNQKNYRKKSK